MTYESGDFKVEKRNAREKAENDGKTGSEVLRNIVRVFDHQRDSDSTHSLEDNRRPDNIVVAGEKAILGNMLAVLKLDANEKRRPDGIE